MHLAHPNILVVYFSVADVLAASYPGLSLICAFRESDLEGKARAIQERLASILEGSIVD